MAPGVHRKLGGPHSQSVPCGKRRIETLVIWSPSSCLLTAVLTSLLVVVPITICWGYQVENKLFFFLAYNKEELEAYQYVEQLAYLITEKVKFLEEGKEPVSPVQIMAIQIEVRSNLDMTYKRSCKSLWLRRYLPRRSSVPCVITIRIRVQWSFIQHGGKEEWSRYVGLKVHTFLDMNIYTVVG
jgi:hypothetical protein